MFAIAPRVVVYPFGEAPPEVGEGWVALPVISEWAPRVGRGAAAAAVGRPLGLAPQAGRDASVGVRPAAGAAAAAVDSGFAPARVFGDGSHPTTRLCATAVDLLCRQQPGMAVLDVGTGTGILARIARARGAGLVVGTDIDPVAVDCARAHAELDGASGAAGTGSLATADAAPGASAVGCLGARDAADVGTPERRIYIGSEPPDSWGARFNLVVANILEAPLHSLAPALCRALVPGGVLLISGFTRPQAPALRLAFETAGLQSIGDFYLDEWVLLKFSAPDARPSHHNFSR